MSDEETQPQIISDDEPMFIPPDAKEAPPTLPSGWHTGKLLHLKQDVRDGQQGPVRFFNIAVVVQHPSLGRCTVGTSPFGAVNTALVGRTNSKAEEFAKTLGVVGQSNAQMKQFEGADVEINVTTRQAKDKRVYADISEIRWPGGE